MTLRCLYNNGKDSGFLEVSCILKPEISGSEMSYLAGNHGQTLKVLEKIFRKCFQNFRLLGFQEGH